MTLAPAGDEAHPGTGSSTPTPRHLPRALRPKDADTVTTAPQCAHPDGPGLQAELPLHRLHLVRAGCALMGIVVVLIVAVVPWCCAWQHHMRAQGDRWR